MAYKTVMSVDLNCRKCKKLALHTATRLEGIDKLTINMKEKTLTVIGDADPICLTKKLRCKFKCARLISHDKVPPPPPPPPPPPSPPPPPPASTPLLPQILFSTTVHR